MRDLASNIKAVVAVPIAVYSTDQNGIAVDRLGFESVTFLLNIGVGGITFTGTNKIEFVATESDDGSNWTAVAGDDLILDGLAPTAVTAGIVRALTAAHPAATVQRVGYIGSKRYARVSPDFSGTHGTGTPIGIAAVLGHPHSAPVT